MHFLSRPLLSVQIQRGTFLISVLVNGGKLCLIVIRDTLFFTQFSANTVLTGMPVNRNREGVAFLSVTICHLQLLKLSKSNPAFALKCTCVMQSNATPVQMQLIPSPAFPQCISTVSNCHKGLNRRPLSLQGRYFFAGSYSNKHY